MIVCTAASRHDSNLELPTPLKLEVSGPQHDETC
jgi:hypothetical protein